MNKFPDEVLVGRDMSGLFVATLPVGERYIHESKGAALEKRCESLDRIIHEDTEREVELKKRIAELGGKINETYTKGFEDGETKQAILEIQGRDKFYNETIKPENTRLKQRVAKLEKALEEIIAGPELYHRDSTRCWQIAKTALAKEGA